MDTKRTFHSVRIKWAVRKNAKDTRFIDIHVKTRADILLRMLTVTLTSSS